MSSKFEGAYFRTHDLISEVDQWSLNWSIHTIYKRTSINLYRIKILSFLSCKFYMYTIDPQNQ